MLSVTIILKVKQFNTIFDKQQYRIKCLIKLNKGVKYGVHFKTEFVWYIILNFKPI